MHVLITGGSGFIGRALVLHLSSQGQRITVLTRSRGRATTVLPEGTGLVEALADIPASDTPDAVVNLAGENLGRRRWSASRKQLFVESRVGTTRRLLEWMRPLDRRPRVLVSGSAVGYYGARGDEELTEQAGSADEYQSELCRVWEAEAQQAEPLGVRVCRIRTGVVLDGGGGALTQMLPPFQLGLGGYFGNGAQWMPWIHRADLVALMTWLLTDEQRSGAYNATAPAPVTNREFARALGRVLHRPAAIPVPAFVVRLMVGEMAHLMLTGQRVVPARALAEGFTFQFPELEAALREILAA